MFMQIADPAGTWLGSWDHAAASIDCGFRILEDLDLPALLRLARDDTVANDLLSTYPGLSHGHYQQYQFTLVSNI